MGWGGNDISISCLQGCKENPVSLGGRVDIASLNNILRKAGLPGWPLVVCKNLDLGRVPTIPGVENGSTCQNCLYTQCGSFWTPACLWRVWNSGMYHVKTADTINPMESWRWGSHDLPWLAPPHGCCHNLLLRELKVPLVTAARGLLATSAWFPLYQTLWAFPSAVSFHCTRSESWVGTQG